MRHVIILAIVVVTLIILWKWDKVDHFDVIQEFPFLPPKYWEPKPPTKWSPWYFQNNEDALYPSMPSVVNYNTDVYRFPPTNCVKKFTPLVEPTDVPTNIPCSSQVEMHPVKEGFVPDGPTIQQIGCGGCMKGQIDPMEEMESKRTCGNVCGSPYGSYNCNFKPCNN